MICNSVVVNECCNVVVLLLCGLFQSVPSFKECGVCQDVVRTNPSTSIERSNTAIDMAITSCFC